ncbi:MarR family winged helix-turn-helix transcriptional regulator [Kineococcus esterisolvens]|uniref:MarR family winged helix-turn-helix transcriptional regulator n=1 Tax=unclassified Kineococcus TaxID=2621656 RepID=UPI003D7CF6C6
MPDGPAAAAADTATGVAGRGPGRTRAAVEAWEAVFRLQATLVRRFAADDVWGGLSLREYDVLHTLSRCPTGRARLGELSEQAYLPQPSLSRLVDRLERHGLLAREADPRDRRGVVVALTDAGAQRQREIGGRHSAAIARQLGHVDTGDLEQLARLAARALPPDA